MTSLTALFAEVVVQFWEGDSGHQCTVVAQCSREKLSLYIKVAFQRHHFELSHTALPGYIFKYNCFFCSSELIFTYEVVNQTIDDEYQCIIQCIITALLSRFFSAWTVLDGSKPSKSWGSKHILNSDTSKKRLSLVDQLVELIPAPFQTRVHATTQSKDTCGQKDFFVYCFAEGCTSAKKSREERGNIRK